MAGRSSTGDLGRYDDDSRPQRWDREKFERYRSRGPESRDSFRFEERDTHGRRSYDTEIDITERDHGGRTRIEVIDRDYEDERPARRRPEFLDRHELTPSEVDKQALAPYRRKSVVERDFDPPARRPARPHFIRRQSSLDTFDRRPMARYGDREREEWRPPTNVPIPLPFRERRRKPSYDDFEEIRYRDYDDSRDTREEYRDIEIRRERSTRRRRRSERSKRAPSSSSSSNASTPRPSVHSASVHSPSVHAPPPPPSVRAPSVHSVSVHHVHEPSVHEPAPPPLPGKKGRTRMPKRLVHKNALIEQGYEFEEEEDFLVVKRALEKDQIDEVIKISESYKESRVTYRYEDTGEPAPPPPPELTSPPPPPASVHSHHTQHIPLPPPPAPLQEYSRPPPPPPDAFVPPPPPPASVYSQHNTRIVEPPHSHHYEEIIEESNHISGPVTSLVHRRPRTEREIREEIRSLEEERRLVRVDRETDYEFAEKPKERDIIRVEKDRKEPEVDGRRTAKQRQKGNILLGAMVSTLT